MIILGLIIKGSYHKIKIPEIGSLGWPEIFLILFALFSFVSWVIRMDDVLAAMLPIFLLLVYFVITYSEQKIDIFKLIRITVYSHLFLIILGLITTEIRLFSYEGIFYNSNSLGQILCTIIVVFFSSSITASDIFKVKLVKIVSLVALFIILILTSSRLSLLVVFLTYISSFVFKRYKKSSKRNALMTIGLLITFILIFWDPLTDLVELSIVSKFERKQDDITSGRIELWVAGISNAGFTGLGRDYFTNAGFDDHSAHNTFVSILVQSGYLAGLSYLFFWISLLYRFFKFRKNPVCRLGFLITLSFILLSLGESMNGKLVMYLSFVLANVNFRNNGYLIKGYLNV